MKKVKLKTQELKEALDSIHKKALEIDRMKMEINVEIPSFWIKFKQIHGQGYYKIEAEKGEVFELTNEEVMNQRKLDK